MTNPFSDALPIPFPHIYKTAHLLSDNPVMTGEELLGDVLSGLVVLVVQTGRGGRVQQMGKCRGIKQGVWNKNRGTIEGVWNKNRYKIEELSIIENRGIILGES